MNSFISKLNGRFTQRSLDEEYSYHKLSVDSKVSEPFQLQRRHQDLTDIQDDSVTAEKFTDQALEQNTSDGPDEVYFTVEEAIEFIGFGPFQIQLGALVGFCSMADSMEIMMLSIIAPELRCVWRLPRWKEALITTVVFLGQFFGASLWGRLCDKYGRKTGLILCSVWIFYYGLMSAFAPTYVWFLFMRMLTGYGISGASQTTTLNSEFLPSHVRGKCLVFMGVFFSVGSIAVALLSYFIMPTLGWRWLLSLSGIPLAIFIMLIWWLPESARYYMLSGQESQAYNVLLNVARQNKKSMPVGRLKPITATPRGRYADMFETKEMTITSIILFYIWFTTAFAYYGIVLYSTELLTNTVDNTCSKTANTASNDCNFSCKTMSSQDYADFIKTTFSEFIGIFFNLVIIDVLGRKKTLSLLCALFAGFTSVQYFCLSRMNMVIFLFCARGSICAVFNVLYIYTTEVFPTTIRGLALGTCSTFARIGAIITPFIAQVILDISPRLAIGIYAASTFVACIAALLLPIETKGRSLKTTIDIFSEMSSEDDESEDEL